MHEDFKNGQRKIPALVLGDLQRSQTAKGIIATRVKRKEFFPNQIFDEYGWQMLLVLFCALADNQTVTEYALISETRVSQNVGRCWLAYLVADGHVEARNDGDDIFLTDRAVTAMRSFLDDARKAINREQPMIS